MPSRSAVTAASALRALTLANVRYWTTVHPRVRAELRHWERRAAEIPDPTWRAIARDKLASEQFNAQVAATLATLAPLPVRALTVRAIVAAEVLYDYLDGASEHTLGGARLYDAFQVALGQADFTADHYFAGLAGNDGGYLHQLATTCREALRRLPAAAAVAAAALDAAGSCATAQTFTHRIPDDGVGPLRAWCQPGAMRHGIAWWEFAAGGAASILAVHALLAAEACSSTTEKDAVAISDAYFFTCALSTLLDSVVDRQRDDRQGSHSFTAYYDDEYAQVRGITAVARQALAGTSQLQHASHHAMTVAGVAGYYLSATGTSMSDAQATALAVERELGPAMRPILAIFALWRCIKRLHSRQRNLPRIVSHDR